MTSQSIKFDKIDQPYELLPSGPSGAELVLAFHPAVDMSRGTKHLVRLALDAGVPVKVIEE